MPGPGHIFVYGTLKRGEKYASRWPHQPRSVQWATLVGELRDLGPYPALLQGKDNVLGELWEIAPADMAATLARLDELEGYQQGGGNLYVREVVQCLTLAAEVREAFAYFYAEPTAIISQPVVLPDRDGFCQWNGRLRTPGTGDHTP